MKENKLISEFMGYEIHTPNGKAFLFKIPNMPTKFTTIENLKYHTSWDWLMPVISKCFRTGDDTHEWDNIMDAMFTCDINIVYEVVVEFINEYNKTK